MFLWLCLPDNFYVVYCNSFKMQQITMSDSTNQTVITFRELLRRFDRELFMQNCTSCCGGITLAQCHTLLEIESREKESLTELANTLGLDKSTISRTVDGLVNAGLADRTIPAENRRMSTIQLTEAGKTLCHSINSKKETYFETILSILSDADKKELLRLLELVTSRMVDVRLLENTCCSNELVGREKSSNE